VTKNLNHMPFATDKPWLAPLAGFSNLPFRLLCREFGASAAVTEMVSAKGMVYGSSGTGALLDTCPEDTPLAVQLFGAEVTFLERACGMLLERGFANIDLNAGCSVKKVLKTGAGAALMSEPQKLAELAAAMVRLAGAGRVGVKMRLGQRAGEETFLECARRLEDVGVGWLALHPRHVTQGYGGSARREALSVLVDAVDVPVMASGDLFTAEDAVSCVRETGVSGVMFARGALRDPAIFSRYRLLLAGGEPPVPTAGHVRGVISRHAHLARMHGRDQGVELKKMRTFAPRYIKGLPGASKLRNAMVGVDSWEELAQIADSLPLEN